MVPQLHLLVPHAPPVAEQYLPGGCLAPLSSELLSDIMASGNHWRKIINCAAKLLFALDAKGHASWQLYRDHFLLRAGSGQYLHAGVVNVHALAGIKIITGKQHGQDVLGPVWQDGDFYLEAEQGIIVSPYFDYRQLSNQKILELRDIIRQLPQS